MDFISTEALLKLEGELVPGFKFVLKIVEIVTGSEVRVEVTGRGEEGLGSGNVDETEEDEVVAGICTRE